MIKHKNTSTNTLLEMQNVVPLDIKNEVLYRLFMDNVYTKEEYLNLHEPYIVYKCPHET